MGCCVMIVPLLLVTTTMLMGIVSCSFTVSANVRLVHNIHFKHGSLWCLIIGNQTARNSHPWHVQFMIFKLALHETIRNGGDDCGGGGCVWGLSEKTNCKSHSDGVSYHHHHHQQHNHHHCQSLRTTLDKVLRLQIQCT